MFAFLFLILFILFLQLVLLSVGALNLTNYNLQPELVLRFDCIKRGSDTLNDSIFIGKFSNLVLSSVLVSYIFKA